MISPAMLVLQSIPPAKPPVYKAHIAARFNPDIDSPVCQAYLDAWHDVPPHVDTPVSSAPGSNRHHTNTEIDQNAISITNSVGSQICDHDRLLPDGSHYAVWQDLIVKRILSTSLHSLKPKITTQLSSKLPIPSSSPTSINPCVHMDHVINTAQAMFVGHSF
ncbi:hypothetical protein Pst134EA_024307 [Puccinia striiformis f. sp. tritici]|uniref:hypothetical protein n=1 Tax=Puccinia striiformis f. sp. tritici TaxID=168172 RepID=UPI0020074FF2|nr:hypothetical protein Pst134EA_024307 [Puccinia striiformis f. sp. tritici]KAH9453432.1 hypothetical protein Pst134EA_024307 [Puccinia striiformis f. sp. tritici]